MEQVFRENMGVKGEPVVSGCKSSDNWTCVTFRPDLAKFGLGRLEEAMVALMRKRVYDLAGVLGKGVKARTMHAARDARACATCFAVCLCMHTGRSAQACLRST